jgi:hypothetical protein
VALNFSGFRFFAAMMEYAGMTVWVIPANVHGFQPTTNDESHSHLSGQSRSTEKRII